MTASETGQVTKRQLDIFVTDLGRSSERNIFHEKGIVKCLGGDKL